MNLNGALNKSYVLYVLNNFEGHSIFTIIRYNMQNNSCIFYLFLLNIDKHKKTTITMRNNSTFVCYYNSI